MIGDHNIAVFGQKGIATENTLIGITGVRPEIIGMPTPVKEVHTREVLPLMATLILVQMPEMIHTILKDGPIRIKGHARSFSNRQVPGWPDPVIELGTANAPGRIYIAIPDGNGIILLRQQGHGKPEQGKTKQQENSMG